MVSRFEHATQSGGGGFLAGVGAPVRAPPARKTPGGGVLLENVVPAPPRVVDAEPVGQLDLAEGVLEELELAAFRPRARELVLVGALRSASDRPRPPPPSPPGPGGGA